MSDPRIGSRLGDYRIESMLGRGGMSVVYLAEHERLKRKAALKVLTPELAEDPAFRQRFVGEWERLAGLDHPNIIPIFEAGEADGLLYIAMRYVDTTDLKDLIRSEGRLEPDRAVAIVTQTASALDAAHSKSLVHRDVKPANILIALGAGFEGIDHAYLSDFGLTKHTDSTSGLTQTGSFMGTIDYVAPEQITGKDVDGRADQYALACVLYQCLTGKVPFPRAEDTAALFAHLQDAPPRPTEIVPELPAAIDDVIARGMAKDPDDRYATCMEFAKTARSALGLGRTSPAGAAARSTTGRSRRRCRGRRAPLPRSRPSLPPTPSKVHPGPGPAPDRVPEAPAPSRGLGPKLPAIAAGVVVIAVVAALAVTQLGGNDDPGGPGASPSASPSVSPTEEPTDEPSPGLGGTDPGPGRVRRPLDRVGDLDETRHRPFAHAGGHVSVHLDRRGAPRRLPHVVRRRRRRGRRRRDRRGDVDDRDGRDLHRPAWVRVLVPDQPGQHLLPVHGHRGLGDREDHQRGRLHPARCGHRPGDPGRRGHEPGRGELRRRAGRRRP